MIKLFILNMVMLMVVAGLLIGCSTVPSSEPKSTHTPTTTELQTQVETLQEELNQLKEQKRTEVLQKAEAYYAIVQYGANSSGATTIQRITAEAVAEQLKASGKFWSLIKATEDPYLISLYQPNEWGMVTRSYSQARNYAESKYRELMSEYYSQQYIDDQLSMLEQSIEETAIQKTEEKVVINNLPFTYTGIGNGRTPAFWNRPTPVYTYKMTFITTWDGDISISWYREATSLAQKPSLFTMEVWRSTGISFGFPTSVEAGKTYEYILNWNNPQDAIFLNIENVPMDGEWTITVFQVDTPILRPQIGITLVIEYDGEFAYQSTYDGNSWGISWAGAFSGNYSKVWGNVQIPRHWRARKEDGGSSPLVLKIIYNGEVVSEDTAIGENNEAWVYWEGPK